MGRKIQHNNIVTDELLAQCNKENIELGNDFLDYLRSVDRSPNTINAYRRDLYIFWVYLLQHCDNKFFIDLSKRDIARYQSFCLTEYKWSPARMRRVKSKILQMRKYSPKLCYLMSKYRECLIIGLKKVSMIRLVF